MWNQPSVGLRGTRPTQRFSNLPVPYICAKDTKVFDGEILTTFACRTETYGGEVSKMALSLSETSLQGEYFGPTEELSDKAIFETSPP